MDLVNVQLNSALMKHATQQESSISKQQTKGAYVIDPKGDLNITVIEYEKRIPHKIDGSEDIDDADQKPPQPVNSATFRVKREIVTSNFPVLRAMLSSGFHSTTVMIKDDSIQAMKILFQISHDRVNIETYGAGIEELWNLAAAIDKYDFDVEKVEKWYKSWYTCRENELDQSKKITRFEVYQQLLFPTLTFNHAHAFLKITRYLVYHGERRITEFNPSRHRHLHLHPRIMQLLNAAKGRLRVVLQRELFKPLQVLLNDKQGKCCMAAVYLYQQALYKLRAWPVELVAHRVSMSNIFTRLGPFRFKSEDNCPRCNNDYTSIVRKAVEVSRAYYDGLCIDCIDKNRPKVVGHDDSDSDYSYNYNNRRYRHNTGCRVDHGEPTWYFSYMGERRSRARPSKGGAGGSAVLEN